MTSRQSSVSDGSSVPPTVFFHDGEAWNLKPRELRGLGAKYAYAEGDLKPSPGCVGLEPYARLERNPFNSLPLPQPRILYRIDDSCPPDSRSSGRVSWLASRKAVGR